MAKDPVEDFHVLATSLRAERQPFAMATVIEVEGSASALTGSKAIFDTSGKNLLGWVGGGCAERYIGEQSLEALEAGQTRIVLADLDDEIFGLGVACGGKMRVFIDPVPPAETVSVPASPEFEQMMQGLARFYGWNLKIDSDLPPPRTMPELMLTLSRAIAKNRNGSFRSLRETKDLPVSFSIPKTTPNHQVTLMGRSRITEALERHFCLLGFETRNLGSRDEIEFRQNEIVIVASHTSHDPKIVEAALNANAGHVAMIGSRKRALEVLQYLQWLEKSEIAAPLFIPAGLDIRARNPDEIALSVVAEILLRESK